VCACQHQAVRSSGTVRARYHHGDLRNALIGAAVELAQSGGPGSVTIRAAARAVGVTPTAAYRHFAGHEELLSAVRDQALDRMGEAVDVEFARLSETGPPAQRALRRLVAIGRGYLAFVAAEPGLFRTALTQPLPMLPPIRTAWDAGPFQQVIAVLDELAAAGFLPVQRRGMAEVTVWAAVHGLAMLYLDGPLRTSDEESRLLAFERTVEIIGVGLGGPALPAELHAELRELVRGG
jgi:AcrR family transcriptional regulator